MFSGLTPLSLGYDKINRDFLTFQASFEFDDFNFDFAVPKTLDKPHIPITDNIP